MNNNDYYNKLQKHIETMESLRAEGKTIGKGIIGESLLKDDLFLRSVRSKLASDRWGQDSSRKALLLSR